MKIHKHIIRYNGGATFNPGSSEPRASLKKKKKKKL